MGRHSRLAKKLSRYKPDLLYSLSPGIGLDSRDMEYDVGLLSSRGL